MNLIELLSEYDAITIFRHTAADQDALGSQFGLKLFIEENFLDKKVYALGDDVGSRSFLFPQRDHVEDEIIENSLAVVLDSANKDRIDDVRFLKAKTIVKIDHHIVVDEYANYSYVDTHAAATCEILSLLFKESGLKVSKQCATYLYYGLIADCLSFTTGNTSPKTFEAAAFLVECGVDVAKVKADTTGMRESVFHYITDIRKKVIKEGKVAYSIMNFEDYQRYQMSYNEAKEKVFALENVDEYEIWCLFTQQEEKGLYNGSLRSRFIPINQVANAFHGGGHKNACGVKGLSLMDIENLIKELNKQGE